MTFAPSCLQRATSLTMPVLLTWRQLATAACRRPASAPTNAGFSYMLVGFEPAVRRCRRLAEEDQPWVGRRLQPEV